MDNYGNAMSCKDDFSMHRAQAAVETEIISAGLFLKGRTRCCFFTAVCQQPTPFCKICGFPRRIQPRFAHPGGNEHSALHILLKMATGRII